MKYAILVDAGFLKRRLGSRDNPMSVGQVREFVRILSERDELRHHCLHRVYYYDAEPLKSEKPIPLTGGKSNWQMHSFKDQDLYEPNLRLLEDLKVTPNVAVRLGDLSFRGWSLKSGILDPKKPGTKIQISSADLQPDVAQKGVDMRIGLDIASLSLKNHVDIIVLVAADSDFIPALKFARREGKQTILYCLGRSIPPTVHEHCDLCFSETLDELRVQTAANPAPTPNPASGSSPPPAPPA